MQRHGNAGQPHVAQGIHDRPATAGVIDEELTLSDQRHPRQERADVRHNGRVGDAQRPAQEMAQGIGRRCWRPVRLFDHHERGVIHALPEIKAHEIGHGVAPNNGATSGLTASMTSLYVKSWSTVSTN